MSSLKFFYTFLTFFFYIISIILHLTPELQSLCPHFFGGALNLSNLSYVRSVTFLILLIREGKDGEKKMLGEVPSIRVIVGWNIFFSLYGCRAQMMRGFISNTTINIFAGIWKDYCEGCEWQSLWKTWNWRVKIAIYIKIKHNIECNKNLSE